MNKAVWASRRSALEQMLLTIFLALVIEDPMLSLQIGELSMVKFLNGTVLILGRIWLAALKMAADC